MPRSLERRFYRIADVRRGAHGFSRDIEYDVARLDPALGGLARWIDASDEDTVIAGPGAPASGCKRQTEGCVLGGSPLRVRSSLGSARRVRQLPDRELDGLVLFVA